MRGLMYWLITGKIQNNLKEEGGSMRKMTECNIYIQNQDNVLGCIYKLLFKYDTETEQI